MRWGGAPWPQPTATWRGPLWQSQAGTACKGQGRPGQGGTALLGCVGERSDWVLPAELWAATRAGRGARLWHTCWRHEKIGDAWGHFGRGSLPPGLPCNSSYPWQHVCDLQTLPLSLELLNAAFQQLRISSLSEGIKCSYQRISLVLSVLKALSGSEHSHPCNWFRRVPKFSLLISTGYGWERKHLNLTHKRRLSRGDGVKHALVMPSRLSFTSLSQTFCANLPYP